MGEVYRARDSRLAHEVAIKVLRADAVQSDNRVHPWPSSGVVHSAPNRPLRRALVHNAYGFISNTLRRTYPIDSKPDPATLLSLISHPDRLPPATLDVL